MTFGSALEAAMFFIQVGRLPPGSVKQTYRTNDFLPSPQGAISHEPVVSVIMVRDLGTRRLPAAVLTFMSWSVGLEGSKRILAVSAMTYAMGKNPGLSHSQAFRKLLVEPLLR